MILFLDDNEARRERFHILIPEGITVQTSQEAIMALQNPWDVVYLDHDLGGQVFVDSRREDTGMEVVRWIVKNKPMVGEFIIHSWNLPAAEEMRRKLIEAGYKAKAIPFSGG